MFFFNTLFCKPVIRYEEVEVRKKLEERKKWRTRNKRGRKLDREKSLLCSLFRAGMLRRYSTSPLCIKCTTPEWGSLLLAAEVVTEPHRRRCERESQHCGIARLLCQNTRIRHDKHDYVVHDAHQLCLSLNIAINVHGLQVPADTKFS